MYTPVLEKYFLTSMKYKHGFTFGNYESCGKVSLNGIIFMREGILCLNRIAQTSMSPDNTP